MVESSIRRDGSFYIPDFIEIQRKSFSQFLEVGIIKEFQKMGPILAGAGKIKIMFDPTRFILTPPDCTIREAILTGKTYESKLYVPAKIVSKGGAEREAEWVLVGSLPLMTRRGHFIINGSPRVIVNQMVRSPGIYFRRQFVGEKIKKQVDYADVIPLGGSWLRLRQKEGEQLYARLKKTPAIPYTLLYTSMAAFEFEEDVSRQKKASCLLWRYRARLALHLLDLFVTYDLSVATLEKVEESLAELREGRLNRLRVNDVWIREVAEQLLSNWVERRESRLMLEEAGPSKDVQEPIIPTLRSRFDAFPAMETAESFKPLRVGKEKEEEGRGEKEFLLHAPPSATAPFNFLWVGGEGEEGSTWSVNKVDVSADRKVVQRKLLVNPGNRARWREMILGEIISSLGLGARRPVAWKGGKAARLIQLMGTADLAEVFNLSINPTKEKRVDPLTEMAALFFLRASPSNWQRGQTFLYKRFKNPATYTLGEFGRARIQKKLEDRAVGWLLSCRSTQLMARDLALAKDYMERFKKKKVVVDDIDHLKNRRVKTCGELLQNQFQVGLDRLKTMFRFKVSRGEESISLKRVIDPKALDGAWREFFGSNPLSQYMDQTNPLAEITHKRRVSCLGPGGVSRETAGMAMRGIHPSHYGRICPIETPEGKNAGLVNSLSSYTWISPEGVLETPYYRVKEGQVQRRGGFHFFSAQREEDDKATIAPADLASFRCNLLPDISLPIRRGENLVDNFSQAARDGIQYVAISRIQMISIATSLIPFLEHNDGNRALMGSNMQRQAVPLLTVEQPIVGTGLEGRVVAESEHVLEARRGGRISYVSGRKILVQRREERVLGPGGWTPRLSTTSLADSRLNGRMMPSFLLSSSSWPSMSLWKLASFIEKCSPLTGQPLSNRFDPTALQRGRLTYSILRSGSTHPPRQARQREGRVSLLIEDVYPLQTFEQSNQKTSLSQRPWVREGEWVQPGDLLADCSASRGGQLALGRNVVIAYLPWDGYNFEDAVVVSDRLLSDDLYTSLHIERYETQAEDSQTEEVIITPFNTHLSRAERASLDKDGVIQVGRWVETGDLLVSKVMLIEPPPLTGYERLAYEILRWRRPSTRDVSFRLPKWIEGRVIEVVKHFEKPPGRPKKLVSVRLYLVERKKIQVGDKVAGRHGNKGIVSTILPRQDMPYLPDGTTVDMVLNPLGVPSRMNVGQVFESLLGLAGGFLNQRFTITPFDEMYGSEASRSLVYLKLYQAKLRTGQEWLFSPAFPGKTRLFDGRSGEAFNEPVTVGRAYMLKLVHLVDEKIHARSRGPYSLITQQPVRGRAKRGGQRLGEMEVWALEGYGAAYTLQEILTTKSDDIESRRKVWQWIIMHPRQSREKEIPLGRSEGFKIVLRELQSLCLDVGLFGSGRREQIDIW